MVSLFQQVMDAVKLNGSPGAMATVGGGVRIIPNFFSAAEKLRTQFESSVSASIEQNDGLTPFTYAFSPENYQFLTASSERIFSRDLVEELITAVSCWSNQTFGTSCVSTPQVRVYVNGCERALARDRTEAKRHWILSLGRVPQNRAADFDFLAQSITAETLDEPLSIDRIVSLKSQFNQLLVHDTNEAYGIHLTTKAMNPLEAEVFVDGYAW